MVLPTPPFCIQTVMQYAICTQPFRAVSLSFIHRCRFCHVSDAVLLLLLYLSFCILSIKAAQFCRSFIVATFYIKQAAQKTGNFVFCAALTGVHSSLPFRRVYSSSNTDISTRIALLPSSCSAFRCPAITVAAELSISSL